MGKAACLRSGKISPRLLKAISAPVLLEAVTEEKKLVTLKDKLSKYDLLSLGKNSSNKEINEIRSVFRNNDEYNDEWIMVSSEFADLYMTALADTLAKENSLSAITNQKSASSVNLRFLAQTEEDDSSNESRGLLLSLIMESIKLDPEISVKRILKFRETRSEQLAELAGHLDELNESMNVNNELNELQEKATRIMENKIRPGMKKLKGELKSNNISSIWSGAFTSASFTVPTGAVAANFFEAPIFLGVSAALTITDAGIKYVKERNKTMRDSPYSYLLEVEKKFTLPK